MTVEAISTPTQYKFVDVYGKPKYFDAVTKLFDSVIAPIYGDQRLALEKIRSGADRKTEILLENKRIAGIIVYKKNPTDEFDRVNAEKALEIKTLFVVQANDNSGRGLGTKLIDRVHAYAMNTKLFKHIVVTVSEEKSDALSFFQRKGFLVVETMIDKYKVGTNELLLVNKI